MCFNTMWIGATQQTWIQLCVFTFMYSFLGSRCVQSNEYYIRRGYKNPGESDLYHKQDVFGYPMGSASSCFPENSFASYKFNPTVSWPWNVTLCTYRCGTYSSGFGANTFLPKEEKCLNNTEVRTLLNGCMTLFAYEGSMSSPLFVLDINDGPKFQKLENSKLKKTCKIVGQQYYTSNGTWENISANCITFLIKQKKLTWVSMDATLYMGRIIKLELKDCKKGNWPVNANECIVFKAQGNFHYRTVVTTTVKLEPSPTPSISHQRSLHTTMPLITSTSYVKVSYTYSSTSPNVTTMALPPLIPSTSEQVSVVTTTNNTTTSVTTMALPPLIPSTSEQVSVVMTATTSAHIEGPTTPYSKGGSSDQRSSNLENVIIGVVTTCVIVIIICLLVAVLYKRRSNDKNRRSSKAANTSANNPSYEQNKNQIIPLSSTQKRPQDNEDYDNVEYDYAAVDGVQVHTNKEQPVYQSIDRGADQKVSQIYQSLANNPHLKNPDNADSKEYSYNHLQHPTYNPSHPKDTSGSLYNSLQKPGGDHEYQEPETQIIDNPTGASEPVCNVLEDPDANPAPQDNDPVYNVLEDPNTNQFPQDNEPVYNVLGDPDDDYDNAPIDDDQNIPASGQDNVAYSSTIDLNIPQSPSSPDYDVLEGPEGALPDSTYQPLGIRVHRQDDVYQTLDRGSQSIPTLEPNDSKA